MDWISAVLCIKHVGDLMSLLWDGDILCRLSTALFPRVKCQLLSRGREYVIHKIIFFLEFCRTIGIRSSALFTISDLVLGIQIDITYSGVFTVLRTIVALEKQARKKGFNGPLLDLKKTKQLETLPKLSFAEPKVINSTDITELNEEKDPFAPTKRESDGGFSINVKIMSSNSPESPIPHDIIDLHKRDVSMDAFIESEVPTSFFIIING